MRLVKSAIDVRFAGDEIDHRSGLLPFRKCLKVRPDFMLHVPPQVIFSCGGISYYCCLSERQHDWKQAAARVADTSQLTPSSRITNARSCSVGKLQSYFLLRSRVQIPGKMLSQMIGDPSHDVLAGLVASFRSA